MDFGHLPVLLALAQQKSPSYPRYPSIEKDNVLFLAAKAFASENFRVTGVSYLP